jgi:DNA-binding transcriptional ArsR family regulator
MSLLPSKPDAVAPEDTEPRVVGVESEEADDLLSALSSDTARGLLAELHDAPAPPGELADAVGTSLQNAQYHLDNLQAAGAIEVVDTAYSEKGREMDVYAPADQPLVIFAGDHERSGTIRNALARLLGAAGVLGAASLAVELLAGNSFDGLFGGGDVPDAAAMQTGATATETATAGLPPGALFFLGGATVLLVAVAFWYVRQ